MIRITIEIDGTTEDVKYKVVSSEDEATQEGTGSDGGAVPEELVQLLGEESGPDSDPEGDGTTTDAGGPPEELLTSVAGAASDAPEDETYENPESS